MIDEKLIIEMRAKKNKARRDFDNTHDEIVGRRVDEIKQRHSKIKARIEALEDEKNELMGGEITNKEVLANAKKAFRESREYVLKELLSEQLHACKYQNFKPFSLDRKFIPDHKIWQILYLALSEQDIEEAVAAFPNTGLSIAKRLSKIKELDDEINSLTKGMSEELEDLKVHLKSLT